ncbi:hypothetical protein DPMN_030756 [Dreissena polymorpha]|uniref:Uncharacterized protein n=1 Tax=Dreissena polymorpha TaxID=45954 RepID=A0A9D4M1H8_DREPO|nr:hypothetical protein DPMN_030756 [Dreissena polymorpha]
MLSQLSTPARHSRSAFVLKVLRRMHFQLKGVKMNAETAKHPSAAFQISIRLIRVMANAEPAQHSSATF